MLATLLMPWPIAPLTDDRLLGTWQSDADRTIAGIREQRPVDDKQEIALRKLFGRMRITYTPATYTVELGGTNDSHRYEVLGKDKHSVVIREVGRRPSAMDGLFAQSEFSVIQYTGPDSYWLYTQIGGIREYFKRAR